MPLVEKNKRSPARFIVMIFYIAGAFYIAFQLADVINNGLDSRTAFFFLVVISIVAYLIQIFIHEIGHLTLGLLSGYHFQSISMAGFMLVRTSEGLKMKKNKIAGAAGYCMMVPPDSIRSKTKIILHFLGGSLFNLAFAAAFLALYLHADKSALPSILYLVFSHFGFYFTLFNGIPLQTMFRGNDAHFAVELYKSAQARSCYLSIQKVSQLISEGKRLKDMPDELFQIPSDEALKYDICVSSAVLACNRVLDRMDFAAAREMYAGLMSKNTGMFGIQRFLMTVDLMYLELIEACRDDVLTSLKENVKHFDKYIKATASYLSVIRMQYACEMILNRNAKAAASKLALFEKAAKSCPYPSDVVSERELLLYAQICGSQPPIILQP